MKLICCMLLAMAAFSGPKAVKPQLYKITAVITGLHSDKGRLYLSLYNSDKGYPKKPSDAFRLTFSSILNGQCCIVLDNIPQGEYAIACFHDENDNGKLDTNLFGIPTEGTGASNNAKGGWGPPKFKDAKFNVHSDTNQTIKIVY